MALDTYVNHGLFKPVPPPTDTRIVTDADEQRFENLFSAALARVVPALSASDAIRRKAGYDYAQGLALQTDDESLVVAMSNTIRNALGLPY
jgi:hypothetical protein